MAKEIKQKPRDDNYSQTLRTPNEKPNDGQVNEGQTLRTPKEDSKSTQK